MNFWKRLWRRFWSNPYKWGLWKWLGGRPWTYIRRDVYHLAPLANIVVFVSVGFFSGVLFPVIRHWVSESGWHLVALFAGVWLLGVIQGHFYWGKRWQKGQEEK